MNETASDDGLTERALRAQLAKLADQAPVDITELDRNLERRVTSIRHRRWSAVGVVTAVVVIGGVATAVALPTPRSAPTAERGHPAVAPPNALGCPQDLTRFTPTAARPGIARTLVPGNPSMAAVCGYSTSGRQLKVGSFPAGFQIPGLTAQLDAVGPTGGCTLSKSSPMAQWASQFEVTRWLFRFRYAAGAEVDVQVTVGPQCPLATNGVLHTVLVAPLDITSPSDFEQSTQPVPGSTTPGNTTRPGAEDASSPAPSPAVG